MAYNDFEELLKKQRAMSPIAGAAALATNGGLSSVAPVAPVRSLAQRAFPNMSAALSGDTGADLASKGNVFNVMGRQARGIGGLVKAGFSDVIGDASAAAVNGAGNAAGQFATGVFTGAPQPVNAISPPGQRAPAVVGPQSQSAPITGPSPGSPGSIEQLGGQTGFVAPQPRDARVDSLNTLNTQRGSGITTSRQANGTLGFTNVGADGTANAVTKPQNFTSGYDLAGSNARTIAARDTNNKIDTQSAIASLTSRARETNDPRQEAALLAQASQLQQGLTANAGAIAAVGLHGAQAGLASAQGAQVAQSTAAAATSAKRLQTVQDKFIGEADPVKQKMLGDQLLVMMGHDPKQGKVQIAVQEEPIDPANPMMGTKKVPYVIDLDTQRVQRVDEAAAAGQIGGKAPGNGVTPPPNHVDALKKNPAALSAQFDAQYGPGAAKRVLGT